jgi:chorismate mutase/prephenate dehydratase
MAKPGTKMSDIKEIFSHEQAIGQCGEFLKGLKDVKITTCANTALAAKMVADSERNDIAAISSMECLDLYGLELVKKNIQTTDNNYTRFICISKKMEIYPGSNKISLILSLPHSPRSLYQAIAKFAALGINLTKLESRPIPGSDFEFLFYFDFEGSVHSPELINLLTELENQPETFVFLGCYTEAI